MLKLGSFFAQHMIEQIKCHNNKFILKILNNHIIMSIKIKKEVVTENE